MATVHHSLSSLGPLHAAQAPTSLPTAPIVERIRIIVHDPHDHEAPAILHQPRIYNAREVDGAAVILISGAGGGVSGPSGIYPSLADKLSLRLAIPVLRLDYREPARTKYCTADVLAAMDHLAQQYRSTRFVIVGWSFGGSPCFTVAAKEPERVVGIATVASQTAMTSGISKLSPRPLLLLHGTGDTVLSVRCSTALYGQYGSEGSRELKTFPGDDHGLSQNAEEAERLLFRFATRTLRFNEDAEKGGGHSWAGGWNERRQAMQEGRDLENGEAVNY
ncbi:uncharacterized protein BP01DRAFT_408871 [Aspergillus saccharolyticus JOP 1030-1]|uniref:Alpha/beta-hydrolase n=1 Tax=Aspergillus saccharolyticus JOP 1030-1 TaxID=1450539 RepID=A0A318Z3B1_9EURO|nr:alpha/beta-hydrolase [Aspergillus saccharolyticus JOP 1030-1]PYH40797.1 alpha/beta-hydrolase [Aspergillus saccharolyticus JOP 1030-1]